MHGITFGKKWDRLQFPKNFLEFMRVLVEVQTFKKNNQINLKLNSQIRQYLLSKNVCWFVEINKSFLNFIAWEASI